MTKTTSDTATTGTKEPDTTWDISDSVFNHVDQIMELYVGVSITLVGILGNVCSLVVISSMDLRKSYNVLLLLVALSGTLYLCSTLNVLRMLCRLRNTPSIAFYREFCISYDELRSYAFYGTWVGIDMVRNIFTFSNFLLPNMIVVERIVAIFCPLKVRMYFTATRTWLAYSGIVLLYTAWSVVYYVDIYEIISITFGNRGNPVTVYAITQYPAHPALEAIDHHVVNHLTGIIPIGVVSVGTVVLALKLVRVIRKRQTMTMSFKQPPSATINTTTSGNNMAAPEADNNSNSRKLPRLSTQVSLNLLSFCVAFILLASIGYAFGLLMTHVDIGYNLRTLLTQCKMTVEMLYCSSNFFIHFMTNHDFVARLKRVRVTWVGRCRRVARREES